ncbi:MAG: 50S ribosomal protein L4 [Candidatus Atribacteria bacterium]|nr:50S ribosomal protein L4 [Candidatus Atribacteria bacterium]
MELEVKNKEGKTVEAFHLDEVLFQREINSHLIYLSVKGYLDNQRQGNAKTKTRGEVSGGGKKPWRQKGTGRARQGSNRSPIWRHGGVVFGPRPRSYNHHLPKNEKRLALISAIADKLKNDAVIIIDQLNINNPKTKEAVEFLNRLNVAGNVLIVVAEKNPVTLRAFNNLPLVKLVSSNELNTFSIVKSDRLIFEKDVLAGIQEVYGI